jgi:hypothetical protein
MIVITTIIVMSFWDKTSPWLLFNYLVARCRINSNNSNNIHVKWVPCHHGMARPQVADGGDGRQIWRVAANILNKQSRTADREWSSSLWVRRGANNPPQ